MKKMHFVKLPIILSFLILSSCNNAHLIIEGSNIPTDKLNDSINISIGNFQINEPLSKFTVDRQYKIDLLEDTIFFKAEVPKMKYVFEKEVPKFEKLYISFSYYFPTSLVQRLITFDSIYRLYPDSLKFKLSINAID